MKKEQNIAIVKEINPIIRKVEGIEIIDKNTMSDGVLLLSQLNKFSDVITKEKEKITKPLNDALREVRGRYKPVELTLDEAILSLKGKISKYQTEAQRKEQEDQQKIADKVASGKLSVDKALTKLENLEEVEEKIQTDAGSVSFRTMKKFEVLDLVKVPIGFHLPNEAKIRKAMMDGIELPGVRYFEEQSVVNKRN